MISIPIRSGVVSTVHLYLNRWSGLWVALLLMVCSPAVAQERDVEFLRIYNTIQEADSLDQNGQAAAALAKYRQAHTALQKFRKANPEWNSKVVAFRLNYLVGKVSALEKPAAPNAEGGATNTPSETRDSATRVKLLEAGGEPRVMLRLKPKPGDKQTLDMTVKTAIEIKVGEMENPPMKMPVMKMAMELTVQSVTPDGDINYEVVTTDTGTTDEPGVLPQVAEALKASLESLKGTSGKGTLSSRGINKSTEVKLPAGVDPKIQPMADQMKEAFSNFAVPLPEEAVGPGARWEVKMLVKSQSIAIDQTAICELASIENGRGVTKSTIAQHAANQKISNPAMPGIKLDLAKMTATGSGAVTFDLSQLAPSEGTMELHSDFSMSLDVGGQKQPMNMKTDMTSRMEGK